MDNKIIELREATGAGVVDCKKALTQAGGDFQKAIQIIQEKGVAKALEKADRKTGAGVLETYIHNGRVGVMLELRCETDFVARTDQFKDLAKTLVMQVAAMNPENVDDLLKQPYIKDPSATIESLVKGTVGKLGENIKVARFARFEL